MTDFFLRAGVAIFFAIGCPILLFFAVLIAAAFAKIPQPGDFGFGFILGVCLGAGVILGAVVGWAITG